MGIGEIHNKHDNKNFESKRWIQYEEKDTANKDPETGVVILLSSRIHHNGQLSYGSLIYTVVDITPVRHMITPVRQ